ncbi:hypothetical protein ACIOMM_35800 [Streptomyces sp. NPDC087908]|uniref:hypothetical protein n=1 Tax=Streptomyces sp. NPDC087908 TaxID=3365820 RepID=UPI003803C378
MHDASRPAASGGYFDRLDADWAALCADPALRRAVTDWVTDGQLTDEFAAVTDSWVGAWTPEQFLAALRPAGDGVTDVLTDAVLRILLKRAADCDRSAVLAGRFVRPGDALCRLPHHPQAGPRPVAALVTPSVT